MIFSGQTEIKNLIHGEDGNGGLVKQIGAISSNVKPLDRRVLRIEIVGGIIGLLTLPAIKEWVTVFISSILHTAK